MKNIVYSKTDERSKKSFQVQHRLEHSITDLNVVITHDNVKDMGELIALCALKHFLPYRNVERYYFGLLKDIDYQNDPSYTFSDGYDFAQTAICFLCNFMGKSLGDTVIGKYKQPVTIRHACYSEVGNMVYRLHQDEIYTFPMRATDKVDSEEPFEEDSTEQSYDKVDEIVSNMQLNERQKQILEYYIQGLGVSEISRLLGVALSTVWRNRLLLQQKYIASIGD